MGGAILPSALVTSLSDLADFLRRVGLADPNELGEWQPLDGGVSSDIWHVRLRSGEYCLKRALKQLKVAAHWEAPVERNATEWAYLEVVSAIAPGTVPKPVAHDQSAGLFAMEWLAPDQFTQWKKELLEGLVRSEIAEALGGLLGQIHAKTADEPAIAARFATDAAFEALRIEPYLLTIASKYSDIAPSIHAVANLLRSTRRALVHGDVSPKNVMVGPDSPVLLDAEVAWFGDPAFDVAFFLNHLLIKQRHLPEKSAQFERAIDGFCAEYRKQISWEQTSKLESRVAALLPALALARVDGKSPVEYLSEQERAQLRRVSFDTILARPSTIDDARRLLVESGHLAAR